VASHREFRPRNLWSLFNAFTEVYKITSPSPAARLSTASVMAAWGWLIDVTMKGSVAGCLRRGSSTYTYRGR
jgi:hypothetical protein